MNGLKLAALYGLKPHSLGFCGAQSKQGVLLKYLKNQDVGDKQAREILETFEAAYPYYKLIARSNNIENPFDERVIRAYWVGNELLDNVEISDLRKMIIKEFSGPKLLPKDLAIERAQLIPENSRPHHSFHVLVIGSITGNPMPGDLCRPCWGRVIELKVKSPANSAGRHQLKVLYRPLAGNKLGKPIEKEIDWDKDILPNVKRGDWVSFHWNQAVEVLTEEDVKNLEKYTKITLKSLQK
jgi:hypothetical protein